MWDHVDSRNRIQISIAALTEVFGVHRDTIARALLAMRKTGRIKFVACRYGKKYIYEVADPLTYQPGDHRSNLSRPKHPVWG